MNSDSLNITVGKAFLRLLILGFIWSVFFGLYKLSGYNDPGLVSVILFLLGAYAVIEVLSAIVNDLLSRKQKTRKPVVHDEVKHKYHKNKKDI